MLPTTTDEILGEDTSDNETSGGLADDPLADASVTVAEGGYYQHHSGSSGSSSSDDSDDSGGSGTSHDTTSGESYDFSDHIRSNSHTPDSDGSDNSDSSSDSGSSSSSDEEHDSLDGSDTTMMEYYEANSAWENEDVTFEKTTTIQGGDRDGETVTVTSDHTASDSGDSSSSDTSDSSGGGLIDDWRTDPTKRAPDNPESRESEDRSGDSDDLPTTTDEILGEDTSDNETSGGPPDDPLADASETVAENDSIPETGILGVPSEYDSVESVTDRVEEVGQSVADSASDGNGGIKPKHLALAAVAVGAGLVYMRG